MPRAPRRSGCGPPSTAPCRWAACRRRRSRWSPGARRRSAPSSPSPTGSSRRSFAATGERLYSGRYLGGKRHRRGRGRRDRRGLHGPAGRDHQAREEGGARAPAAPLRPHLAPAPREHALRLLGAAHARRGAAALRAAQGDHLPAHQLALPDRRHDRRDQARPPSWSATTPQYAQGRRVRDRARAASRSSAWSTTRRSQDHHAIIPTRSEHDLGRRWAQDELQGLRPGRQALPRRSSIPRRCSSARASRPRSRSTCSARAAGVLLEAGWKAVYGEEAAAPSGADDDSGGDQAAAQARAGRGGRDPLGRVAAQGDPAAAALHRGLAARPRWRRPARTSRTPSCARR